ncbi:MAG: peptidylprolyl isomerase [Bacteriovoracaceae bacterium]|jgi:FKBP-type peptidyl-prolyl cis-trans isomerase SlyD|nr:peptidylprolyl isomerase [Bacteriovoracaceae bacterium]
MSQNVIGFHYTLKDKDGNTIDTSVGATPLLILEGTGHIIPGLEKEITSLNIGDKKQVHVTPADGYGEVISDLIITVKKTQFPEGTELKLGDQFQVNEDPHAPLFTVIEIKDEEVVVDGNHPMAGKDLFFDIEITEKREATAEELAHGHAHGEGGHQH